MRECWLLPIFLGIFRLFRPKSMVPLCGPLFLCDRLLESSEETSLVVEVDPPSSEFERVLPLTTALYEEVFVRERVSVAVGTCVR